MFPGFSPPPPLPLHFNLTEIIKDGQLVISFIHVPAKKCKTVKTLIGKVVGGRVGGYMYDRQRCSGK